MIPVITASIVVISASLVGVVLAWTLFGGHIQRNSGLLVSFSAGVFLVLVYMLLGEVFGHSPSLVNPLIWIMVGIAGITLLFRFLPRFHHHHSDEHEDHSHDTLDARRIVVSDSFHNIGDGILLAASFAISIPVGIAATTSIFVHELVQELSEFFVLKQAGLSTKKALTVNFISSLSILIGSLGGYVLLESFEKLEVPLLAFSAGAFLVVVIQDLIPESVRRSRLKKQYFYHVLFFILGMATMIGVDYLMPHVEEVHADTVSVESSVISFDSTIRYI